MRKVGDKLIISARDVTNAYLQAIESQRLVTNKQPSEFAQLFPELSLYLREEIYQSYGDITYRKYCHHTILTSLNSIIFQHQKGMFAPSFLLHSNVPATNAICMDYIISDMH